MILIFILAKFLNATPAARADKNTLRLTNPSVNDVTTSHLGLDDVIVLENKTDYDTIKVLIMDPDDPLDNDVVGLKLREIDRHMVSGADRSLDKKRFIRL